MALSIPDIMALHEVRTANEAGRAVLVLSPNLDAVHFANTAANSLFAGQAASGDAADGLSAWLASRQLRTIGPVLREDGEAMLRLKAASEGFEVWVTAHVLLTSAGEGAPIALLTAPVPSAVREDVDALARRLLIESGREDAVILTAGALGPANVPTVDPSIQAAADAFSKGGEDRESGEDGSFWRLATGLVLAVGPQRALVLADAAAPHSQIGALIERWRSRDGTEADQLLPPVPAESDAPEAGPAGPEAAGFVAPLDGEPVRFIWQIDAEGRFRQLSPEFAAIVGPAAADVLGVSFAEVAEAFGFDEEGEIAGLLERRDTWSGRSIHWPVEGTDRKVLVDLAALPIYGRDRSFEGFRGFGVVRPSENILDPEAIGLILVGADGPGDPAFAVAPQEPEYDPVETASQDAHEAEPEEAEPVFGRRARPPVPAPQTRTVVSFDEHRRRDALLSPAEEDAFKAIGAELAPQDVAIPAPAKVEGIGEEASAILSAVALPLLVEMRGKLVFANPAFLGFATYDRLDDLVAAGGLDALFADGEDGGSEESAVRLLTGSGAVRQARVQMQRVRFSGRSCLVFSFSPVAEAAMDAAGSEESYREEVEELRSVLDTATDGILLLDPAGAVRSMNGSAEALLGVEPSAYEGRHFTEFLAPQSRRPARDYLESLREEGLAGVLNDGREVVAEVSGRGNIPLFITVGRLNDARGWCVVLRDIAHWKRAEEELVTARRQAEDASLHKSRFLANISHELRTPLNAIIGFADVMTAETYGPIGHERYMEYLGDIKRSGHHVLDLVNDLLDISKIEAGKVELAFEAVSLNEVVSEVVSLMQPQANRERVIVRSNLPSGVPPVVADRRTLRQIALNLVANAIRFTPAGGQIIASTSYGEDGEVALRFRDSGIGMTDREIEIALTPFQQVNSASKERGDGTGLGLPLTKAMVEANRALFRIASTPGEGTLIEITFPAQRVLAH